MVKQVLDDILLAEKEAEQTVRKARQMAADLRREADMAQEQEKRKLKEQIRQLIQERLEAESRRLESEDVAHTAEHHDPTLLRQVTEDIARLMCSPFDGKDI